MTDSSRLQQLLQFQSASPDDAFLLFALAKEHEKLGNGNLALEYYEKTATTSPDYVGTYYHFGKFLEKIGEPAKAFEMYKLGMAVAQKLGDSHALSELAGAKMELGEEEDF